MCERPGSQSVEFDRIEKGELETLLEYRTMPIHRALKGSPVMHEAEPSMDIIWRTATKSGGRQLRSSVEARRHD